MYADYKLDGQRCRLRPESSSIDIWMIKNFQSKIEPTLRKRIVCPEKSKKRKQMHTQKQIWIENLLN